MRNQNRCFKCLSVGHYKINCREPIKCLHCHRFGHTYRFCSQKLHKSKKPSDCRVPVQTMPIGPDIPPLSDSPPHHPIPRQPHQPHKNHAYQLHTQSNWKPGVVISIPELVNTVKGPGIVAIGGVHCLLHYPPFSALNGESLQPLKSPFTLTKATLQLDFKKSASGFSFLGNDQPLIQVDIQTGIFNAYSLKMGPLFTAHYSIPKNSVFGFELGRFNFFTTSRSGITLGLKFGDLRSLYTTFTDFSSGPVHVLDYGSLSIASSSTVLFSKPSKVQCLLPPSDELDASTQFVAESPEESPPGFSGPPKYQQTTLRRIPRLRENHTGPYQTTTQRAQLVVYKDVQQKIRSPRRKSSANTSPSDYTNNNAPLKIFQAEALVSAAGVTITPLIADQLNKALSTPNDMSVVASLDLKIPKESAREELVI